MFNLFYHELRRYIPFALIIMVLHSAIWAFVATQKSVLQFGAKENFLTVILVDGLCLAFGLVQYLLHKRKSHWAWLVHRPLSLSQIHSALFAAGLVAVIVAIIVPFAGVIVTMDIFTNEVVELRHYWFIPHVLLMAMASYALGCYAALSANKGAILCLGLLNYLSKDGAYSTTLLLSADVLVFAVLFYLCRKSFKVDLNQQFTRKRDIAVSTLAMQPLLILLLWMTQVPLYHLPLILIDAHPDHYPTEKLKDTYSIVHHYTLAEYVDAVTTESNYPDREVLVQQMEFAKEYYLRSSSKPVAVRGQVFHLDTRYGLNDEKQGHHWRFSHNEMVLVGLDKDSGQRIGYLGKQGFIAQNAVVTEQDRFDAIPALDSNLYIRTKSVLYIVDFEQQTMSIKHQLADDEHYLSDVQFNQELKLAMLVSDKALYLFDAEQMLEYDQRAKAFNRIEHARPLIEQGYISYIAMPDGYLINYYGPHYLGHNQPGTELFYARFDGSTERLGGLTFARKRPTHPVAEYQYFWISPVIAGYVGGVINGWYEPHRPYSFINLDNYIPRQYPASAYVMIALMTLLSLGGTIYVGNKIALPRDKLIFWCGLNLICGLPGLAAFLLLNAWWGFWRRPLKHTSH